MVAPNNIKAKFDFGKVVATAGIMEHINHDQEVLRGYMNRHVQGDWGEVREEDWSRNEQAVVDGGRLVSVYRFLDETKFYIVTEAAHDSHHHRSATTFLLPEEY